MYIYFCFVAHFVFFLSLFRPPPSSTLFPYTTLFRSNIEAALASDDADLAGSFVELARDKDIPLNEEISTRVSDAVEGGCFRLDRKSTRLNSSHVSISYAVFCLKKKKLQMFT